MKNTFIKNIGITAVYYLYLLLTIYFYEVSLPDQKQPIMCGQGYLFFLLPFVTLLVSFFIITMLLITSKNKKIIWSILIILPLLIWMYFYGNIMLEILEIIFDNR